MTQRWFQRFNIWEENTKDSPRFVRHKILFIGNIRRDLEENSQESTRRLSEELGAAKDTIITIINTSTTAQFEPRPPAELSSRLLYLWQLATIL